MVQAFLALILAAPLLQPGDVASVSPTHIVVTLPDDLSPDGILESWYFQATEGTDDNYARVGPPEAITFLTSPRPVGFGDTDASDTVARALITLPEPLQEGSTYRLNYVPDVGDGELEVLWMHAPTVRWTPSIKVNQLGYLPEGISRRAYVNFWLHNNTPMSLEDGQSGFTVYQVEDGDGAIAVDIEAALADASDQVVLRGVVAQRTNADSNPYEDGYQGLDDRYGSSYSYSTVYELNLNELLESGRYYIVWDGVGRSWPFSIGHDVYDSAFRSVFNALYLQRCGEALLPEHTQYVRDACHREVEASVTTAEGFGDNDEGDLEIAAGATEDTVTQSGGYHDGPDYGRHIEQLHLVDDLIDLYELDKNRFSGRDLGIPQLEANVPDVIAAALHAVEFFEGLQLTLAPNAGAVRAGLIPVQGIRNPQRPASQDRREFYALAPSVRASYRFASAAAKVSRVLLDFDPGRADELREAAEKAFKWAHENRPPERTVGDIDDPDVGGQVVDDDADENLGGADGGRSQTILKDHWWDAQAAAELLKTTSDPKYDAFFIEYVPLQQGDDRIISVPLFADDDYAIPLMAYLGAENTSPEQRAAVKAFLEERVRGWLEAAENNAFRMVKRVFYGVGQGSVTVPRYAALLFRYNELIRDAQALEYGIFACDVSLGANPSGMSWVTGLGSNSVQHPLHVALPPEGVLDAPSGVPVFGPCEAPRLCPTGRSELATIDQYFEPPVEQWPPALRYADRVDVDKLNGTSVGYNFGPSLFAYGYLAKLGQAFDPGGRPVNMPAEPGEEDDSVAMPAMPSGGADAIGRMDSPSGGSGDDTPGNSSLSAGTSAMDESSSAGTMVAEAGGSMGAADDEGESGCSCRSTAGQSAIPMVMWAALLVVGLMRRRVW